MMMGKYPMPIRAVNTFAFTKAPRALTFRLKRRVAYRRELITLHTMLLEARTSKTFIRFERPSLNVHSTKIPDSPDILLFETTQSQPRKIFISYDNELLELDRAHAAAHDGEVWDVTTGEVLPPSDRLLYDIWESALLNYRPAPRPHRDLCGKCSAGNKCKFSAKK